MACWCLAWVAVVVVAALYALFDVNYFLRLALTLGIARFIQRKKNSVFHTTSIYSVCLPSDLDLFLQHMNNARYIRELDVARFDFYIRCGLYEEMMVRRKGGNAFMGASNIRYRRSIPLFSTYRIDTQLVWWDDKAVYLEHKFITLSDGFVRAVCLSKQSIVGMTVDEAMVALAGGDVQKPPLPEDLAHWLASIQASSSKLRPKTN